jgi:hypothetical protein
MFVKLTHAQNLTKFVGMLMPHLDIKFHMQLTSLHGTINMDFMWVPVIHFTQKLNKICMLFREPSPYGLSGHYTKWW